MMSEAGMCSKAHQKADKKKDTATDKASKATEAPPSKQPGRNETASPVTAKQESNAGVKKPSHKLEDRWNVMFERLSKYREEHGDCLVPNRYRKDPSLGAWVSSQRRQYRRSRDSGGEQQMDPERVKLLEALGFAWETKDPRQVPWETRFKQLADFKQQNGHCLVPIAYKKNPKLANWVSAQRQEGKNLREGRHSRLSKDKIALLDSIGFVWRAPKGASSFSKRLQFQKLLDSKRRKSSESSVTPSDDDDPGGLQASVSKRQDGKTSSKTPSGVGSSSNPTSTSDKRAANIESQAPSSLPRFERSSSSLPPASLGGLAINALHRHAGTLRDPVPGLASLGDAHVEAARRRVEEQLRAIASQGQGDYVRASHGLTGYRDDVSSLLASSLGIGSGNTLSLARAAAAEQQQGSDPTAQLLAAARLASQPSVYDALSRVAADSSIRRWATTPALPSADLYGGGSALDLALLSTIQRSNSVDPLLAPSFLPTSSSTAASRALLSSLGNSLLPSQLQEQAALVALQRRLGGVRSDASNIVQRGQERDRQGGR